MMAEGSSRRFPWGATLLVLAAVAVMVRLGFWQLERLAWKEALIARYSAAQADTSAHPWPSDRAALSYSRVSSECAKVLSQSAVAGENARHQSGWAPQADCLMTGGARAKVRLGWANRPAAVAWAGGAVAGTLLLQQDGAVAIVADPPLAGLAANARPDPRNLPNNHFSYAVQWFRFAATAVVIYGLALRKRLQGKG